jgi:PAS domain S-box-containing protein
MKDEAKTKKQLIEELGELRRQLSELDKLAPERRLSEEALRESEERHRVLFESSRDAIMILAPPSWNFTSGNPTTIRMFGARDEQDLCSRPPWKYSPEFQPDGRPSVDTAKKMIQTAMRDGSNFFEWTHRRTGGEEFPATVLLSRIEISGQVLLQATVRDITERKISEQELRASESRYRTLIEQFPLSIQIFAPNGRNIQVNKAWEDLWGIPFAAAADYNILNDNHVVDRGVMPYIKKGFGGEATEIPPILYDPEESNVAPHEANKRWVRAYIYPLKNDAGQIYEVVFIHEDITRRKQAEEAVKESEERQQSILDNSTAVIYVKDLDDRYILINRWFETLFDVDRVSVKGKTDYDIFPREMADAFRKNDLKVIKAKAPIEFDEIAPHDDGLHSYISIKFPLFNSIGEICAVCGISTDITERKTAEAQLHQKSRELEVLTEDLRRLSSLLSKEEELSRKRLAGTLHEQIGQSLAVFNMKFDDITEGIITGETKIKETISNLMPLLENTISSTRELTSDLYPTILDDLGFLPAITWYKDLVLEPLKIAVLMDIDKSVEDLSSDYKLPLFRITQEAFQNISKHASATEVEVKFSTHSRSMKLYIKDNGVGFDLKEMKAKKDKGIGLRLLKERSISLGGSLTIESALGKGTELTIELPINKQ